MKKIIGYLQNQNGFGLYEVIGIVAVLIVAAFVVIPGFRSFAEGIMASMNTWVDGTIVANLFPTA